MAASTPSSDPPGLVDFINENWEGLKAFEGQAEDALIRASRKLPAHFYDGMRRDILRLFTDSIEEQFDTLGSSTKNESKPVFRLVVDANIIIHDVFAVAKGRHSTTARIFESPFLLVLAPPQIKDEVERAIQNKLPKGADPTKARAHATLLLSRIRILEPTETEAMDKARRLIAMHDPDDVPYLALAFQTRAHGVVSRDTKSIGKQSAVKRLELKDGVSMIVGVESGTLSVAITGAAVDVILELLNDVVLLLLKALREVAEVIAQFIAIITTKTLDALSSLPEWAFWVLLGISVAVLVLLIAVEDFRNWVVDKAQKIGGFLSEVLHPIGEMIVALWRGLKTILVWVWHFLVVPVVSISIFAAAALLKRIVAMEQQLANAGVS